MLKRRKEAPGQEVSKTTYAHLRHVSPATISQAAKDGRIRLINGRVNVEEADATWYRRHLQHQDGRRSGAEIEARREQAITQALAAKLVMTRHRAEQMRDALVERDKSQAEIGSATADARAGLKAVQLEQALVDAIATDSGDLEAEALRVTR